MIKKESLRKSTKMILLFGGLPIVVFFAVVGLAILLQSSLYSDISLVDKRVIVADDEQNLLVIDSTDGVSFRYSIEEWRYGAENSWFDYSFSNLTTPDNFTAFRGVSAFPASDRELIFSVTGSLNGELISLFTILDIRSRGMKFFEEITEGEVGNIVWSPEKNYFAYFTSDNNQEGTLLLINSIEKLNQAIRVDENDLFNEVVAADYTPEFRMMQWGDDQEELFFTVNSPQEEGESIRMKVSLGSGEIFVVEN